EKRTDAVRALLKQELDEGIFDEKYYKAFAGKVESLRNDLMKLLSELKQSGKRVAVYGASAKGSTLMNYFGIDNSLVEYVVDRSTVKQGHYTPGTHLQIHPTEKLVSDKPDYVVLLTWNFADEILEQQAEYRKSGGKFIIPIPSLRIV